MSIATLGPFDFGKIVDAIQRVEERLYRATTALNRAGIPYAVIGGNAVANWVSRMNPSAVRFIKDVDLLIQRNDLAAMIPALEQSGFKYRHAAGIDFSWMTTAVSLKMPCMSSLPMSGSGLNTRFQHLQLRKPKWAAIIAYSLWRRWCV